MTRRSKPKKSPGLFDIVVGTIGAVTATISAVRAVQGAAKAWQRVYTDIRGGQKPGKDA